MARKLKDKQEVIAIVEKIQLALSLALGDKSNLKYTPKFFGNLILINSSILFINKIDELPKLNKLRESSFTPENYLNYRNVH